MRRYRIDFRVDVDTTEPGNARTVLASLLRTYPGAVRVLSSPPISHRVLANSEVHEVEGE